MEKVYEERFWKKVDKRGRDECWVWTGGVNRWGYGNFKWNGHVSNASRFSWELFNGVIPPKIFVCHKCDNPPCVNPNHLFLGTHSDNMRDAYQKGRMRGHESYKGEKSNLSKLTEKEVVLIRALRKDENLKLRELAKRFSVTEVAISKIINRQTWAHVE